MSDRRADAAEPSTEGLTPITISVPTAGPGEVLVRVRAVALISDFSL